MSWLDFGQKTSPGFETNNSNNETGKPTNNNNKDNVLFAGLTPSQALVVVSHVKEEIPDCVDEWLRLPGEEEVAETERSIEGGRTPQRGWVKSQEGWKKVWGL